MKNSTTMVRIKMKSSDGQKYAGLEGTYRLGYESLHVSATNFVNKNEREKIPKEFSK